MKIRNFKEFLDKFDPDSELYIKRWNPITGQYTYDKADPIVFCQGILLDPRKFIGTFYLEVDNPDLDRAPEEVSEVDSNAVYIDFGVF